MLHSNNIAVAVKCDGKVLRESGDSVTLPFSSEYSIFIKNLNSVRVQVEVSIDGKKTHNNRYVIGPNQSLDLERFDLSGNQSTGNRFKFIERSAKIEAHRGIEAEDGLIRVEAWREKIAPVINEVHTHHYDHYYPGYPWRPRLWPYYPYYGWPHWGETWCKSDTNNTGGLNSSVSLNNVSFAASNSTGGSPLRSMDMNCATPPNDAGITVPGSRSFQQFTTVSGFALESQSTVVVLKLRGEVAGKRVAKAVTVKAKAQCATCGKKNPPKAQFCLECGTAVSVFA